jgi:hypothetical protein
MGDSGTAHTDAQPASGGQEHPSVVSRLRHRLSPAGVTAIVALISAAVALAFELWPSLKPDPGEQFTGAVHVVTVERGVTGTEWAKESDRDHWREKLAQFQQKHGSPTLSGEVAYVDATVQGFKRQSTKLQWTIYDAKTGERVTTEDLKEVPDFDRTAEAPTDRSVQLVWLPPLNDPHRRYFVRIELLAPDNTFLAVADSKPFRGLE